MKQIILTSLLVAVALAQVTNTVTLSNGFVMTYSISGTVITFTLKGTNKGYIALGFGGKGMANIDAVAFQWDGTTIVAEDRTNIDNSGSVPTDISKSCNNDINLDSSSKYDTTTGAWDLKFSRPLDTKETTCDQVISTGSSQNLAFAVFGDFTWKEHTSKNSWSITYSTTAQADPNSSSLLKFTYLTLSLIMMIFV